MADNYLEDIKKISIRDLEIFELFLKNDNIESISKKLKINPKEVTLNLQGVIKQFTATIEKTPSEKKEKILTVSESDIKSFKDSGKILNKLKIIRKIFSFNMEDIAKEIGIERQTYSKIENGEIDLSIKYIDRITDFFVNTFKNNLYTFVSDYNENVEQYNLDEFNQENINKMIWYHNFLQPLTDYEKKALLKVGSKNTEDTLAQLLLYNYSVNHVYYLFKSKEELNKKIKDARFPFEHELSDKGYYQKKLRLLNNEILYAADLRNFIFSNLQKNKFVDYRNYYFELLFLPRVILNEAILEKITNLIQEIKK